MKKQTIIILSMVSIVFSLFYTIFDYYGINRYISLHFCSEDNHINNYSKLDKADDKTRVVLSITTTSQRINKIKPVILSLIDQTTKVDEIAISIPYGKKYKIPKYLKDIAQVYRYSVDYNNAGNLIPVLLREREGNTKIILVNDTVVYGKDFVEIIVDESNKNPQNAIVVKKINSNNGILVKPDFFDISVMDYDNNYNCSEWLSKKLLTDVRNINYSENFKSFK